MSDSEKVPYRVIISLKLPDTGEKASVTLLLSPSDPVVGQGGVVKPLRDCTLAELRQYAEGLEAEAWLAYEDVPLPDLVEASQVGLAFRIESPEGLDSVPPEVEQAWLEHLIVLSAPDEPAEPAADERVEEALEADTVSTETAEDATVSPTDDRDGAAEVRELDKDTVGVAVDQPDEVPDTTSGPGEGAKATEEETSVSEGPPDLVEAPEVLPRTRRLRILGRRRPLNHPTWSAVDILVNEPAFRTTQAHALSSLDKEVAGVLIGPPPEKQPDGRYVVHISDAIIAKHTRMHGASVTYTPESWRYVNDRLVELYPDESAVIVGWYHTHPGFGIFLSGMDLFIHQNFFNQVWHVALVLDPLARRSGFFAWDRQLSKVDAYEFPWPEWAAHSW